MSRTDHEFDCLREALNESQERFKALTQSAIDAIITATATGEILSWNKGAEVIFGYTEAEVLGQPLTILMPERYRDAHRAGLARAATGKFQVMGKTVELEGLRQDGRTFPLELSLSFWRSGTDVFYLGIARDISTRKTLEEQLRQAQKMEAVGRLAGGVAHDFNNLMMAVNGFSDLLLQELDPQNPRRKKVEQIREAGERAVELTRQLLAFSRRQVLQPRVLDLNTLVSNTMEMLRRLIGEHIELRIEPEATGRIKADPGQLLQVLVNLSVNARDAMPHGGSLRITTADVGLNGACSVLPPGLKPGRYVLLSVIDTGIGMDSATKAHLFEPFFTTKPPGKGTGLGLSVVYGIVEHSGGHIECQSDSGAGTTFHVYFPTVEEPVEASTSKGPLRDLSGGTETILVVEDESIVRDLICEALKPQGYHLLSAQTGLEALTLCRTHQGAIDLLLTDMVMPGMSGKQLAATVLSLWPNIKVMYISGHAEETLADVRSGGTMFLRKPVSPTMLVQQVRQVLDA
jgi:PAS domain S-box-containing protein